MTQYFPLLPSGLGAIDLCHYSSYQSAVSKGTKGLGLSSGNCYVTGLPQANLRTQYCPMLQKVGSIKRQLICVMILIIQNLQYYPLITRALVPQMEVDMF